MGTVHVVGSVNLDLVAAAGRLPRPGETVGGATFSRHPGGKGANQALAAARMGADTTLSAAVGPDAEPALAMLRAEPGVTLDLHSVDAPTGVALIVVDGAGENQIVVAPGANHHLGPVPPRDGDVLLVQLEVPLPAVAAALRHTTGIRCLNAAPSLDGIASLLADCDVLIVNEVERADLTAEIRGFTGLLVTTLGADGAVAERQGRTESRATPPPVEPIDTVGAGDAFCGAFAAELADGRDLDRALALAVTAGALATETPGAQPSLPHRPAVEARCPSPS